mmetsp:Transcript_26790/g.92177  ORF Transcript_26790/g.92177 Transcript_26790/m.92177 type:complete len:140 (-) Transcript_26790:84-503(-)
MCALIVAPRWSTVCRSSRSGVRDAVTAQDRGREEAVDALCRRCAVGLWRSLEEAGSFAALDCANAVVAALPHNGCDRSDASLTRSRCSTPATAARTRGVGGPLDDADGSCWRLSIWFIVKRVASRASLTAVVPFNDDAS